MSDTITTNGNAHNDVIAPLPIVLNEKFIEEHIQYKLEIKAIKKEQDIIKDKYIDTNYMDLKLENLENNIENSMDSKLANIENSMDSKLANLENSMDSKLDNLEHKFDEKFDKIDEKFDKIDEKFDKIDEKFDKIDEKFVTLERKFDDKFTEVDKTLTKMDAKISQSMLQMMFGTISAMGIFMTILFFLLQHYK